MNILKSEKPEYDVIIVGGGLAGLVASIELAKANKKILLIEKKTYPYHKVCGEYISNEVLNYLNKLGFNPFSFDASRITNLRISDTRGTNYYMPLGLGGFGISRYTMDEALCTICIESGAIVKTDTKVTDITFQNQIFSVTTNNNELFTATLVIGSYGKREMLDKKLNRSFMNKQSGYLGVKYHIKTQYPDNEIGLDNFEGGYCGISKVNGERYNLCYLYQRSEKNNYKSLAELEQNVLFKNPVLRKIFSESEFLFDSPEVINEICFDPKTQVENHILMCGDTAGLITPLCGNGMSMAITAAELLTRLILQSKLLETSADLANVRELLEIKYQQEWNKKFRKRLFVGRTVQHFFGNSTLTNLTLKTLHFTPSLQRKLIDATHGKSF